MINKLKQSFSLPKFTRVVIDDEYEVDENTEVNRVALELIARTYNRFLVWFLVLIFGRKLLPQAKSLYLRRENFRNILDKRIKENIDGG